MSAPGPHNQYQSLLSDSKISILFKFCICGRTPQPVTAPTLGKGAPVNDDGGREGGREGEGDR
eukprot:2657618-Rhodomonas_salina.1